MTLPMIGVSLSMNLSTLGSSGDWAGSTFCSCGYPLIEDGLNEKLLKNRSNREDSQVGKECFSEKLCAARRGVFETRFNAMDKALGDRTSDLERRLEGLNQLRNEVTKDRELLLRKDAYDMKVAYYDRFVADASQALTRMETRYEGRITFATMMSVVAAVAAVLAVFIPYITHK
jgi:hypothetical protein